MELPTVRGVTGVAESKRTMLQVGRGDVLSYGEQFMRKTTRPGHAGRAGGLQCFLGHVGITWASIQT